MKTTTLLAAAAPLLVFGSVACASATEPASTTSDDAVNGAQQEPGAELAAAPLPAPTSRTIPASGEPRRTAREAEKPVDVGGEGGGGEGGGTGAGTFFSPERQVAAKLGLPNRFLVGLGNDVTGNDASQTMAYALGPKVDIHYLYLSGVTWPEWDLPAGSYITKATAAAKSRGIVPMFTLYQAAAYGENNLGAFATTEFMTKYWRGVRIMFEKIGAFGDPTIVHVEPDLWGYTQQKGDDPAAVPMKVGAIVPECADLPANAAGMARCVLRLGRTIAPNAVIGFSASSFGAFTGGVSDPDRIGAYMKAIGAGDADILVVETLDRDAGCFEKATDANCKRSGSFYWDESNVAHPNFHDHLAWAKTLRTVVGRPLLWWQMPLGVPASSAGGSTNRYRDNRVRYLFNHPSEFAAAGGIGAVFGTGASNQTTVQTDNNQFKNALTGYLASPAALP